MTRRSTDGDSGAPRDDAAGDQLLSDGRRDEVEASYARAAEAGDGAACGGSDSTVTGGNEFLHAQPYGAAVSSTGAAHRETGQRGFVHKLNYYDPQGRLLATDVHTPGLQGTTFAGRTHVPAGETFSRNPTSGPQLATVPGNS